MYTYTYTLSSYVPLNLLSVENLDCHLVPRELVLRALDLSKAAVAQCLSHDVPGGGGGGGGGGGEEEEGRGGGEGEDIDTTVIHSYSNDIVQRSYIERTARLPCTSYKFWPETANQFRD